MKTIQNATLLELFTNIATDGVGTMALCWTWSLTLSMHGGKKGVLETPLYIFPICTLLWRSSDVTWRHESLTTVLFVQHLI